MHVPTPEYGPRAFVVGIQAATPFTGGDVVGGCSRGGLKTYNYASLFSYLRY